MVFGGPGRQVETGVVVAVQATSLSDVQGFSIRTADGRTVDFRVGTHRERDAVPARPPRRAQGQPRAGPGDVRPDVRRAPGGPARGRAVARPPARTADRSAGLDRLDRRLELLGREHELERRADLAVGADDEDVRLGLELERRRRLDRDQLVVRARAPAGASRRRTSSWYGSTLMKVISGWAAATGLSLSSVGPQTAVWQNFGVAKIEHERLLRRRARRPRRSGRRPGRASGPIEIFATSPPTSARVGVLTDGAGSPGNTTWRVCSDVEAERTVVSAGEPGAPLVKSADPAARARERWRGRRRRRSRPRWPR